MAMKFLFVILLVVLFTILQFEMYSAIHIELTPTRFTGENNEVVKISCQLDDEEAAAKEIMALKVSKKGEKALVILYPNNTIAYVTGNRNDITATGRMLQPVSNSYLDVVIKTPEMDDTGTYTCNIFYMGESGNMVEDKASAYLTVDDPDVKNMKEEVKTIKEMILSLTKRVDEIQPSTPLVAFSVTNQRTAIQARQGSNLIFPDIITQIGSKGYNRNKGVFTAPVGGLYSFTLIVRLECRACYIRVAMYAASKILFKLKVGSYDDAAQGTASSVVQLRKGDTAYPYVDYSTQGVKLTPERLSVFSGHLINKYA